MKPSLLSVSACLAVSLLLAPARGATQARPAEGGAAAAQGLIERMGARLATSLRDPEMRAWLYREVRRSPYVEWRIPLRDELERNKELTGRLLPPNLRGQRSTLPALELYFPLPEQRSTWHGIEVPDVAVPKADRSGYTIHTAFGTSWSVGEDYYPVRPTVVLGPSEIDYLDLPSALRGGERTGRAVGPPVPPVPCDPEVDECGGGGGGGGGGGTPPPWPIPGGDISRVTYLAAFETFVEHDTFLAGSDEVEFFASINNGYKGCYRHTGVEPFQPFVFGNTVHALAPASPMPPATLFVDVWEDDDTACVLKAADDPFGHMNIAASQYDTLVASVPSFPMSEVQVSVHAPPSSCNGTSGQWSGCRGNGCAVCSELVTLYRCYFFNHPSCSLNEGCGGQYFTCNSNCPAPTSADIC